MKTPFSDDTVPKVKKPMQPLPKMACGDNYGIGYKSKIGKIRGDTVGYIPVSKRVLRTPPKSVV